MSKPTGGPAFPVQPTLQHPNGDIEWTDRSFYGMTLRDYFAGQSVESARAIVERGYCGDSAEDDNLSKIIASVAYELADAMIAAREGK